MGQRSTGDGADTNNPLDVTIALLDAVEDHGRVPFEDELDDEPASVRQAVERIRQQAAAEEVVVEDLLLELKRLISLSDGIPNAEDVDDWMGDEESETYEAIFGSVENAVELALAADAGELRVVVNGHYRGNSESD